MTDPDPSRSAETPSKTEAPGDLVQAVEALDQLIEAHKEDLCRQADLLPAEEEIPDHPQAAPLLKEQAGAKGMKSRPQTGAEDLFAGEEDGGESANDPARETQHLVEELRAVIDAGLSRVAESTRAAVAQELRGAGNSGNTINPAAADFTAPEDLRTLANAVDVVLKRHGLGSARQEELYGELISELGRILRVGLEWLHRNMALAVSNRLQARARRLLHDAAGGDAAQQDWLAAATPAVAAGGENGDNPQHHHRDSPPH